MSQAQILIVDDCKQWRQKLRSMLEAIPGYQVVSEAADALEGIEKTARLHPEIVLLDIGMPLLNGIEAAPRIRQASPRSKIVFVTQENDQDVRVAALTAGGEGYVLKSRILSELVTAIDALLIEPGAQQVPHVPAIVTMPAHTLAIELEQHPF